VAVAAEVRRVLGALVMALVLPEMVG